MYKLKTSDWIAIIALLISILVAFNQYHLSERLSLEQQVGERIKSIGNDLKYCKKNFTDISDIVRKAKVEWQNGNSYKAFIILGDLNQPRLEELSRCPTEPVIELWILLVLLGVSFVFAILFLWFLEKP